MRLRRIRTKHPVGDASDDLLEAQALQMLETFVRQKLAAQVLEHCGIVGLTHTQMDFKPFLVAYV